MGTMKTAYAAEKGRLTMNMPTLRPRQHAYGLTIMEVRLPQQPFLLFPDPRLIAPLLTGPFERVEWHHVDTAGDTAVSPVLFDGQADGDLGFEFDWGDDDDVAELDSHIRQVIGHADPEDVRQALTAVDPEEARYHLRRRNEIDAAKADQPGDWGWRYYMSETGMRCRNCHTLFEDGEHQPWCPVGAGLQ